MRKLLSVILFVGASATAALCQSSGYSSTPGAQGSIQQQNHAWLGSVPITDSLLEEGRKEGGSSLSRISYEERSLSRAEPAAQSADDNEGRFWVVAESLIWKTRGTNLPPLITTGLDPGPGGTGGTGRIGEPGAVIVYGGRRLDRGLFAGGRLSAGMWLNQGGSVGVELSYLFLLQRTNVFQVSTSGRRGSNVISRPFINVFTGQEDVITVAGPAAFQADPLALFSGSIRATSPSRLRGAEANFIYRFDRRGCCRISLTGGFRYLDLNERLTLTNIGDTNSTFGLEFRSVVTDDFLTRNRFYGGQIGARNLSAWGPFSLELSGTLALGINRQLVNINGSTMLRSASGFTANSAAAILAVRSNIGSYRRSEFTLVPEVRLGLGYDLTRLVRPFVSYNFLYWNKVVMPGEQIDRVVNPNLLFGTITPPILSPARPAFTFRDSVYRAMGFTAGVKVRF